jgi:hypothetical protein
MSKTPPPRKAKAAKSKAVIKRPDSNLASVTGFDEVLALIQSARLQTAPAVNTALIELYWNIGQNCLGHII